MASQREPNALQVGPDEVDHTIFQTAAQRHLAALAYRYGLSSASSAGGFSVRYVGKTGAIEVEYDARERRIFAFLLDPKETSFRCALEDIAGLRHMRLPRHWYRARSRYELEESLAGLDALYDTVAHLELRGDRSVFPRIKQVQKARERWGCWAWFCLAVL